MPTAVAHIIQEVEAEPHPAVQREIFLKHAEDPVLREFLRRTFDPFLDYGVHVVLPHDPITNPEEINAALDAEWVDFQDILDGLVKGGVTSDDLGPWWKSPAAPMYRRCVSKALGTDKERLIDADTANVWGDIPVWMLGYPVRIGGDIKFPFYVEPDYVGKRYIVIVHSPYDDCSRVVVYDRRGHVIPDRPFPEKTRRALAKLEHQLWLYGDPRFDAGLVLDGVLESRPEGEEKRYVIFDVMPLECFRSYEVFEPYHNRRDLLRILADMLKYHAAPFAPSISRMCVGKETLLGLIDENKDDERRKVCAGLIGKVPNAEYPHYQQGEWFWIRRKA